MAYMTEKERLDIESSEIVQRLSDHLLSVFDHGGSVQFLGACWLFRNSIHEMETEMWNTLLDKHAPEGQNEPDFN